MELRDGKGVDTLKGNRAVVMLDLTHADADLVAKEVISAKGSHVHVAADGHELGPREIVECQVILEDFADVDDLVM